MIDILVSTFGESRLSLLKLHKTLPTSCKLKIVHQQPDVSIRKDFESLNAVIEYHPSNTIGLSKSRNLALALGSNKICLIADDDVSYIDGFEVDILDAFDSFPEADIIIFRIVTPEGLPYKKYWKEKLWLRKRHVLKPSSIEMALRIDSIINNDLKFDELFGLGAKFQLGEEAIFLSDALDKGLKILFLPIDIVKHPFESSGKTLTMASLRARGGQLARIFGPLFPVANFAFYLKIILNGSTKLAIFSFVFLFIGSFEYYKGKFKIRQ